MHLRAILLLLPLAIGSCATLDENECRSGDWRQLGYVDGLKGYAMSRLAEHQKACARYVVVPDTTAWQLGYVEGQARYCTAPSGYEQGRDGRSYANVCPPERDVAFRPAWEDGRRVAALLDQLEAVDQRLREIADDLAEDDRRGSAYLNAVRDGREPVERPVLLDRTLRFQLEREYEQLAADYAAIQDEIARTDADLSAVYGVTPLTPVLRSY